MMAVARPEPCPIT